MHATLKAEEKGIIRKDSRAKEEKRVEIAGSRTEIATSRTRVKGRTRAKKKKQEEKLRRSKKARHNDREKNPNTC